MPPTALNVQPPSSSIPGSARKWLEAQGYPSSISKSIRSRDFGTVDEDPFLLYLTSRLGLTSPLDAGTACRRGSWLHVRAEARDKPSGFISSFMEQKIEDRIAEIREVSKLCNYSEEKRMRIELEVREDAVSAWTWFDAALQYRNPESSMLKDGLAAYLKRFQSLAREIDLTYLDPRYPKVPLVITIDDLLYRPETKTLWIADYKSVGYSPLVRMAQVRIEPQPRHYAYVTQNCLSELISRFSLPPDTKLGGVIHICIQKPGFKFATNDNRPFHFYSLGARKKMHGRADFDAKLKNWTVRARPLDEPLPPIVEDTTRVKDFQEASLWLQEACGKLPEKVYTGDPDRTIYTKRCVEFYQGVGEFAELGQKRLVEKDSAVNISSTSAALLLDSSSLDMYHRRLARVYHYATCPADPENFEQTGGGMIRYFRLSRWHKFYLMPVQNWPSLIAEYNLIQHFRNDEMPIPTE
jgi:hypothetical protein